MLACRRRNEFSFASASTGRKTPEEYDAYDLCRRGRYHLNTFAPEGLRTAAATFRQAIALMPDLAEAHVGLSRALMSAVLYGGSDDRTADRAEAEREARRALAIDDQDADTHYVLALHYCYRGEFDNALAAAQRAVSLNPNFALGHFRLGQVLIFSGHMEEGLAAIDVGLRLSPIDPQAFIWLTFKGWAFYLLDRYDDALIVGLAAKRLRAMPYVYRLLIATYGQLGRHAEAEVAIAEAKAAEFEGLFGSLGGPLPFANPAHRAHIEEGLHKAGLAE